MNPTWSLLKIVGAVAGALILVAVLAYFLTAPQRAAQARQDANVAEGQAKGAADNGKMAIDVIGKNAASADAIDQTTGENHDRITGAEGAGEQVGAGVDLAGRCSVCLRDSAKGSASCKRLLKSGSCGVAQGGR